MDTKAKYPNLAMLANPMPCMTCDNIVLVVRTYLDIVKDHWKSGNGKPVFDDTEHLAEYIAERTELLFEDVYSLVSAEAFANGAAREGLFWAKVYNGDLTPDQAPVIE